MVKCLICNREFEKLNRHLSIHNISTEEYYIKYLGNVNYCKICGNKTKFKGLILGYTTFCSKSCSAIYQFQDLDFRRENGRRISKAWCVKTDKQKEKIKQNISAGTKNGMANMNLIAFKNSCSIGQSKRWKNMSSEDYNIYCEKVKNSLVYFDRDKANIKRKQTNLSRYGVENAHNRIVKEKCEQTSLKNFGVKYNFQRKEIQELAHNPESFKKKQITARKNGTESSLEFYFETSCNNIGLEFYTQGETKDSRYPYNYDFYIPDKDLFIEINGNWTHGGHWFDENNLDDIEKLKFWQSKNTKYYDTAIKTWTVRDVEKRNCAKRNDLNYIVLWNKEDIDRWFKLNCPVGKDWVKEYNWKF